MDVLVSDLRLCPELAGQAQVRLRVPSPGLRSVHRRRGQGQFIKNLTVKFVTRFGSQSVQ